MPGRSIVDRLEARRGAASSVTDLDALLDDIRLLLNARVRDRAELDAFPRLRQSSFTLGLRDFTGVAFATPEEAASAIALDIKTTLQRFEPRLTSVSVLPSVRDGGLCFDVHAYLTGALSERRAITVQATLDGLSSHFIVTR